MSGVSVSRPTVVTGPTIEPLTRAQAAKQCELSPTDTSHDDHLNELIQAAREQWEKDTDSTCLTQTLSVTVGFPNDDEIDLPSRPIQSITSITYYDSTNTQQTLLSSIYGLDAPSRSVRLKYLQFWPSTLSRWDAMTITYVAGYSSAAAVPAYHKQAMKLLVGHNFLNRDMLLSDNMQTWRAYENLVARTLRPTYP